MKDKYRIEGEYRINVKTGIAVYIGKKSAVSPPEKRLMAMINGDQPQNESEERMQKQIKEIAARGHIVDIPSM